MNHAPGDSPTDQLTALVKRALAMADALDLPYVAIFLDEARVALEGPMADDAALRALGADWLDDDEAIAHRPQPLAPSDRIEMR